MNSFLQFLSLMGYSSLYFVFFCKITMLIIDTPFAEAQFIMDKDAQLLETLRPDAEPILHFYQWKNPSITYGYFLKPENFFYLEKLIQLKIDLARRPTGGGFVFHLWDFAFSVLIPANSHVFSPKTFENYHFINSCVLSAIREISPDIFSLFGFFEENDFAKDFCMVHPTKYDVVIANKKVAGAAQRKKKNGYLHQGSICVEKSDISLLKKILISQEIIEKIKSCSFFLTEDKNKAKKIKKELRQLLIKYLQKSLS